MKGSKKAKVDYRLTKDQSKIDKELFQIINKMLKRRKDEILGISIVKGRVESGNSSITSSLFFLMDGYDGLQERKRIKKLPKRALCALQFVAIA